MKPAIKDERQNKKLAELLGLTPEAVQALRSKEDSDTHVREATGVLLFIEHPEAFITKRCDECKNTFATTYQFVSVCSTTCRIRSLKKIGIDWNPLHTPEERWKRSKIPTEYSIPPRALQKLLEIARELEAELQENTEPQAYVVPGTEILTEIFAPDESHQSSDQSYNDPPESEPEQLPVSKDPESVDSLLGFDPFEF